MKYGIMAFVLMMAVASAAANDNGKAGRTSRLGEGCGDCHGITASAATSVTMPGIGDGPVTMAPGTTREFTIVIAHATQPVAGIGIAVHDAADGGVNVGTLTPVSHLQRKSTTGELTHATPVVMSGGAASFTFTWTAPEVVGTYYIQAIGNACNGDEAEDAQDHWAWMAPVPITVATTSGIAEAPSLERQRPMVSPSPLAAGSTAVIGGLPAGRNTIIIQDLAGNVMQRQDVHATSDSENLPLRTPSLQPGVYALTVLNGGRAIRTTLLVH